MRWVRCPTCEGMGSIDGTECPTCGGAGGLYAEEPREPWTVLPWLLIASGISALAVIALGMWLASL